MAVQRARTGHGSTLELSLRHPDPAPLLTARDKFELRQLREAGVSVKEAAAYKNVSVSATAMRALADLRRILGPEKHPTGAAPGSTGLTHRIENRSSDHA